MKPLALALLLLSPILSAENASTLKPTPVPKPAFKAGEAVIDAADIILTPKKGYVHMLVDLFPSREIFKGRSAADLILVAERGVTDYASPKHAKAPYFKVDVVEFKDRDEYGAPRWDSVKLLGKFAVTRKGKGPWHAAAAKAAK